MIPRGFFVKIPLHPEGLWCHYYKDADDMEGTLAFVSYGTSVVAPITMAQMVGHITHVEGNPYLLLTVVPVSKPVHESEKFQKLRLSTICAHMNKRLVRDYPHLRKTVTPENFATMEDLQSWQDGNSNGRPKNENDREQVEKERLEGESLAIPEEVEKAYCLIRVRRYSDRPISKGAKVLDLSLDSKDDWRNKFKGRDYSVIHKLSDCTCP